MGCGDVKDFIEDPIGTISDFASGLVEDVEDFLSEDLGLGETFANILLLAPNAITWMWELGDLAINGVDIPDTEVPGGSGSSTYAGNTPINTIKEGSPIPYIFGKCKVAGNIIRSNDPEDSDIRCIVAYSMGPINQVTETEINAIAWADLEGSPSKTEYTGTTSQTPDGRFTDKAQAYRSIAYTAYTFPKNEQISRVPRCTHVVEGIKCPTLADPNVMAFTRNPAVILAYIYTQLEGYAWSDLDVTEFQALETYCDAVPTGGTLPRYRFDFVFDTKSSLDDMKQEIFRSFNGMVVESQGQLKPVWEKSRSSDYSFTLDNIIYGTFKDWGEPTERPNIVRIYYIDSDNDYKKTSIELRDDDDIDANGEIVYEERCWWITDEEIAKRRCQFRFDKIKYTNAVCTLSSGYDSAKLEVYDRVTVTHTLAGYSSKDFIIRKKSQDQNGRCVFLLEAYYAGIYHDREAEVQTGYAITLSNPYSPNAATSISLAEGGEIAGDGSYIPYLILTFTRPLDDVFWDHVEVYLSTDDFDYTYYGDAKNSGYKIEAVSGDFKEGDTVYVKLISVNRQTGAKQAMPATADDSITIQGKTALPSDVTNFSVAQQGDILIFSWTKVSGPTDADVKGYEIRDGVTWSTGVVVDTEITGTTYLLKTFTAGSHLYHIKAIDRSGNYSENSVYASIDATRVSENIYHSREELQNMGDASVSQIARIYNVPQFFIEGTERMNDDMGDTMDDDNTERMWSPGYTSGTYESEVVDIGSVITASILIALESATPTGASILIEINTSEDNIVWSGWQTYVFGTYTFRYYKIKVTLTCDKTTYPQDNVAVTDLDILIDVPDKTDGGEDIIIVAGGTSITFNQTYYASSSIRLKLTLTENAAKFPVAYNKTTSGFDCRVYDTNGSSVGGTIDWEAVGY